MMHAAEGDAAVCMRVVCALRIGAKTILSEWVCGILVYSEARLSWIVCATSAIEVS